MQVHVGVQGADRAVRVCDRLRPVLPLLLAISRELALRRPDRLRPAHGPHADFTKSFPRCGDPGRVRRLGRRGRDYVDLLVRTDSIVEFTQLWWSVRPHHDFGTVEVRICDAQTTAQEADALAGADRRLRARARSRRSTRARPRPICRGRLIEENMWRAIRYGLDGTLLDLEAPRIEEYPGRRGARPAEGAGPAPTCALPELNGAQRQRRMIDAGAAPAEVYAAAVTETHATYRPGGDASR